MPLPVRIKLFPIKDDDPQVQENPLDCFLTDASIGKLQKLWSVADVDVAIEDSFICAITDTDDHELACERGNSTFVTCHRLKSPDVNFKEDVSIKTGTTILDIHVTWVFIEHYSLSHEEDRKNLFLVKIDNLINLKSVVIGEVSTGHEKSRTSPTMGSLIRLSDFFLGNKSSVVVDCTPVCQGIISSSTCITYVSITKPQFKTFLCPRKIVSTRLYYPPEKLAGGDCLQVVLLNKIFDDPNVLDPENVVVVSHSVARALKLTTAQVSCFRATIVDDDFNECEWRFVQVITSNEVGHENVALISPQLWFNFVRTIEGKTFSVNDTLTLKIDPESQFHPNLCDDDFSNEATIALIPSPSYAGSCDFTTLLTSYLSKPRFMLKRDIFGVSSLTDLSFNNQVDDPLRMNLYPTIYFKVTSMDGSGFWIQKDKTALRQISSVHSFIPRSLGLYHKASFDPMYMSQPQPRYHYPNYSSVDDVVRPFIQKKIDNCPFILISGPSGSGKRTLVEKVAADWNINLLKIDTNQILFDTPAATETKIKIVAEKAAVHSPVIVLIENIELVCIDQSGNDDRISQTITQSFKQADKVSESWPILVVATTSNPDLIYKTSSISSIFNHVINVKDLNEIERLQTLKDLTTNLSLSRTIDLKSLSKRMIGFNFSDIKLLISKTIGNLHERLHHENLNVNDFSLSLSIPQIILEDTEKALKVMLKRISQSIGAPEVPCVKWSDVGGLEEVKKEILDTIQLPLLHRELRSSNGLKRGGVLLYGPPGTGKTLLAKAVATECSLNFLSVKGPELINMYVGQSEQNVRDVFARARSVAPCVIFFDELDSLAPARGRSGDSGGVMDRVVSQLLAEMDGLNKCCELFVIGATNRPDLLDESLLRPGRFDRLIEVKVPSDVSTRISILKSLTRKFNLSPNLDLFQIESRSPKNMTGADFYSLTSLAVSNCITRCIQQIELEQVKEEKVQITLEMHDFEEALSKYQGPTSSSSS